MYYCGFSGFHQPEIDQFQACHQVWFFERKTKIEKMDFGPTMCHVFGSLLGLFLLMIYSMNLHFILFTIYEIM